MKKLPGYGLILTSLLAVSACGWQLRGGIGVRGLDSIHIRADNPQSAFARTLASALGNQQVTLADSAGQARYQVVVLAEDSLNRTASITSSARAAEYLLVEEVRITVLDNSGQVLVPATLLRAERSLDFDENQIIGKADEVKLVTRELLDDLVQQLLNRLQRLPGQQS